MPRTTTLTTSNNNNNLKNDSSGNSSSNSSKKPLFEKLQDNPSELFDNADVGTAIINTPISPKQGETCVFIYPRYSLIEDELDWYAGKVFVNIDDSRGEDNLNTLKTTTKKIASVAKLSMLVQNGGHFAVFVYVGDKEIILEPISMGLQKDGHNCGVWAVLFYEVIMENFDEMVERFHKGQYRDRLIELTKQKVKDYGGIEAARKVMAYRALTPKELQNMPSETINGILGATLHAKINAKQQQHEKEIIAFYETSNKKYTAVDFIAAVKHIDILTLRRIVVSLKKGESTFDVLHKDKEGLTALDYALKVTLHQHAHLAVPLLMTLVLIPEYSGLIEKLKANTDYKTVLQRKLNDFPCGWDVFELKYKHEIEAKLVELFKPNTAPSTSSQTPNNNNNGAAYQSNWSDNFADSKEHSKNLRDIGVFWTNPNCQADNGIVGTAIKNTPVNPRWGEVLVYEAGMGAADFNQSGSFYENKIIVNLSNNKNIEEDRNNTKELSGKAVITFLVKSADNLIMYVYPRRCSEIKLDTSVLGLSTNNNWGDWTLIIYEVIMEHLDEMYGHFQNNTYVDILKKYIREKVAQYGGMEEVRKVLRMRSLSQADQESYYKGDIEQHLGSKLVVALDTQYKKYSVEVEKFYDDQSNQKYTATDFINAIKFKDFLKIESIILSIRKGNTTINIVAEDVQGKSLLDYAIDLYSEQSNKNTYRLLRLFTLIPEWRSPLQARIQIDQSLIALMQGKTVRPEADYFELKYNREIETNLAELLKPYSSAANNNNVAPSLTATTTSPASTPSQTTNNNNSATTTATTTTTTTPPPPKATATTTPNNTVSSVSSQTSNNNNNNNNNNNLNRGKQAIGGESQLVGFINKILRLLNEISEETGLTDQKPNSLSFFLEFTFAERFQMIRRFWDSISSKDKVIKALLSQIKAFGNNIEIEAKKNTPDSQNKILVLFILALRQYLDILEKQNISLAQYSELKVKYKLLISDVEKLFSSRASSLNIYPGNLTFSQTIEKLATDPSALRLITNTNTISIFSLTKEYMNEFCNSLMYLEHALEGKTILFTDYKKHLNYFYDIYTLFIDINKKEINSFNEINLAMIFNLLNRIGDLDPTLPDSAQKICLLSLEIFQRIILILQNNHTEVDSKDFSILNSKYNTAVTAVEKFFKKNNISWELVNTDLSNLPLRQHIEVLAKNNIALIDKGLEQTPIKINANNHKTNTTTPETNKSDANGGVFEKFTSLFRSKKKTVTKEEEKPETNKDKYSLKKIEQCLTNSRNNLETLNQNGKLVILVGSEFNQLNDIAVALLKSKKEFVKAVDEINKNELDNNEKAIVNNIIDLSNKIIKIANQIIQNKKASLENIEEICIRFNLIIQYYLEINSDAQLSSLSKEILQLTSIIFTKIYTDPLKTISDKIQIQKLALDNKLEQEYESLEKGITGETPHNDATPFSDQNGNGTTSAVILQTTNNNNTNKVEKKKNQPAIKQPAKVSKKKASGTTENTAANTLPRENEPIHTVEKFLVDNFGSIKLLVEPLKDKEITLKELKLVIDSLWQKCSSSSGLKDIHNKNDNIYKLIELAQNEQDYKKSFIYFLATMELIIARTKLVKDYRYTQFKNDVYSVLFKKLNSIVKIKDGENLETLINKLTLNPHTKVEIELNTPPISAAPPSSGNSHFPANNTSDQNDNNNQEGYKNISQANMPNTPPAPNSNSAQQNNSTPPSNNPLPPVTVIATYAELDVGMFVARRDLDHHIKKLDKLISDYSNSLIDNPDAENKLEINKLIERLQCKKNCLIENKEIVNELENNTAKAIDEITTKYKIKANKLSIQKIFAIIEIVFDIQVEKLSLQNSGSFDFAVIKEHIERLNREIGEEILSTIKSAKDLDNIDEQLKEIKHLFDKKQREHALKFFMLFAQRFDDYITKYLKLAETAASQKLNIEHSFFLLPLSQYSTVLEKIKTSLVCLTTDEEIHEKFKRRLNIHQEKIRNIYRILVDQDDAKFFVQTLEEADANSEKLRNLIKKRPNDLKPEELKELNDGINILNSYKNLIHERFFKATWKVGTLRRCKIIVEENQPQKEAYDAGFLAQVRNQLKVNERYELKQDDIYKLAFALVQELEKLNTAASKLSRNATALIEQKEATQKNKNIDVNPNKQEVKENNNDNNNNDDDQKNKVVSHEELMADAEALFKHSEDIPPFGLGSSFQNLQEKTVFDTLDFRHGGLEENIHSLSAFIEKAEKYYDKQPVVSLKDTTISLVFFRKLEHIVRCLNIFSQVENKLFFLSQVKIDSPEKVQAVEDFYKICDLISVIQKEKDLLFKVKGGTYNFTSINKALEEINRYANGQFQPIEKIKQLDSLNLNGAFFKKTLDSHESEALLNNLLKVPTENGLSGGLFYDFYQIIHQIKINYQLAQKDGMEVNKAYYLKPLETYLEQLYVSACGIKLLTDNREKRKEVIEYFEHLEKVITDLDKEVSNGQTSSIFSELKEKIKNYKEILNDFYTIPILVGNTEPQVPQQKRHKLTAMERTISSGLFKPMPPIPTQPTLQNNTLNADGSKDEETDANNSNSSNSSDNRLEPIKENLQEQINEQINYLAGAIKQMADNPLICRINAGYFGDNFKYAIESLQSIIEKNEQDPDKKAHDKDRVNFIFSKLKCCYSTQEFGEGYMRSLLPALMILDDLVVDLNERFGLENRNVNEDGFVTKELRKKIVNGYFESRSEYRDKKKDKKKKNKKQNAQTSGDERIQLAMLDISKAIFIEKITLLKRKIGDKNIPPEKKTQLQVALQKILLENHELQAEGRKDLEDTTDPGDEIIYWAKNYFSGLSYFDETKSSDDREDLLKEHYERLLTNFCAIVDDYKKPGLLETFFNKLRKVDNETIKEKDTKLVDQLKDLLTDGFLVTFISKIAPSRKDNSDIIVLYNEAYQALQSAQENDEKTLTNIKIIFEFFRTILKLKTTGQKFKKIFAKKGPLHKLWGFKTSKDKGTQKKKSVAVSNGNNIIAHLVNIENQEAKTDPSNNNNNNSNDKERKNMKQDVKLNTFLGNKLFAILIEISVIKCHQTTEANQKYILLLRHLVKAIVTKIGDFSYAKKLVFYNPGALPESEKEFDNINTLALPELGNIEELANVLLNDIPQKEILIKFASNYFAGLDTTFVENKVEKQYQEILTELQKFIHDPNIFELSKDGIIEKLGPIIENGFLYGYISKSQSEESYNAYIDVLNSFGRLNKAEQIDTEALITFLKKFCEFLKIAPDSPTKNSADFLSFGADVDKLEHKIDDEGLKEKQRCREQEEKAREAEEKERQEAKRREVEDKLRREQEENERVEREAAEEEERQRKEAEEQKQKEKQEQEKKDEEKAKSILAEEEKKRNKPKDGKEEEKDEKKPAEKTEKAKAPVIPVNTQSMCTNGIPVVYTNNHTFSSNATNVLSSTTIAQLKAVYLKLQNDNIKLALDKAEKMALALGTVHSAGFAALGAIVIVLKGTVVTGGISILLAAAPWVGAGIMYYLYNRKRKINENNFKEESDNLINQLVEYLNSSSVRNPDPTTELLDRYLPDGYTQHDLGRAILQVLQVHLNTKKPAESYTFEYNDHDFVANAIYQYYISTLKTKIPKKTPEDLRPQLYHEARVSKLLDPLELQHIIDVVAGVVYSSFYASRKYPDGDKPTFIQEPLIRNLNALLLLYSNELKEIAAHPYDSKQAFNSEDNKATGMWRRDADLKLIALHTLISVWLNQILYCAGGDVLCVLNIIDSLKPENKESLRHIFITQLDKNPTLAGLYPSVFNPIYGLVAPERSGLYPSVVNPDDLYSLVNPRIAFAFQNRLTKEKIDEIIIIRKEVLRGKSDTNRSQKIIEDSSYYFTPNSLRQQIDYIFERMQEENQENFNRLDPKFDPKNKKYTPYKKEEFYVHLILDILQQYYLVDSPNRFNFNELLKLLDKSKISALLLEGILRPKLSTKGLSYVDVSVELLKELVNDSLVNDSPHLQKFLLDLFKGKNSNPRDFINEIRRMIDDWTVAGNDPIVLIQQLLQAFSKTNIPFFNKSLCNKVLSYIMAAYEEDNLVAATRQPLIDIIGEFKGDKEKQHYREIFQKSAYKILLSNDKCTLLEIRHALEVLISPILPDKDTEINIEALKIRTLFVLDTIFKSDIFKSDGSSLFSEELACNIFDKIMQSLAQTQKNNYSFYVRAFVINYFTTNSQNFIVKSTAENAASAMIRKHIAIWLSDAVKSEKVKNVTVLDLQSLKGLMGGDEVSAKVEAEKETKNHNTLVTLTLNNIVQAHVNPVPVVCNLFCEVEAVSNRNGIPAAAGIVANAFAQPTTIALPEAKVDEKEGKMEAVDPAAPPPSVDSDLITLKYTVEVLPFVNNLFQNAAGENPVQLLRRGHNLEAIKKELEKRVDARITLASMLYAFYQSTVNKDASATIKLFTPTNILCIKIEDLINSSGLVGSETDPRVICAIAILKSPYEDKVRNEILKQIFSIYKKRPKTAYNDLNIYQFYCKVKKALDDNDDNENPYVIGTENYKEFDLYKDNPRFKSLASNEKAKARLWLAYYKDHPKNDESIVFNSENPDYFDIGGRLYMYWLASFSEGGVEDDSFKALIDGVIAQKLTQKEPIEKVTQQAQVWIRSLLAVTENQREEAAKIILDRLIDKLDAHGIDKKPVIQTIYKECRASVGNVSGRYLDAIFLAKYDYANCLDEITLKDALKRRIEISKKSSYPGSFFLLPPSYDFRFLEWRQYSNLLFALFNHYESNLHNADGFKTYIKEFMPKGSKNNDACKLLVKELLKTLMWLDKMQPEKNMHQDARKIITSVLLAYVDTLKSANPNITNNEVHRKLLELERDYLQKEYEAQMQRYKTDTAQWNKDKLIELFKLENTNADELTMLHRQQIAILTEKLRTNTTLADAYEVVDTLENLDCHLALGTLKMIYPIDDPATAEFYSLSKVAEKEAEFAAAHAPAAAAAAADMPPAGHPPAPPPPPPPPPAILGADASSKEEENSDDEGADLSDSRYRPQAVL